MPSTTWRSQVSDALLTRLWPVPLLAVVSAIGAGLAVPALDRAIDDALPHVRMLSGSTIDDAREVLGTITTAMMTVTSLTFSLTVVTLQLASGQYSPRLLRTFARDRFVQITMGLFLATFAYALTVLKNVQNGPGHTVYAVPHLAVSLAAVLTLLSVVGLVFFLAHLVGEIRVETMMHTVCADALDAGAHTFRVMESAAEPEAVPQPRPTPPCSRGAPPAFWSASMRRRWSPPPPGPTPWSSFTATPAIGSSRATRWASRGRTTGVTAWRGTGWKSSRIASRRRCERARSGLPFRTSPMGCAN